MVQSDGAPLLHAAGVPQGPLGESLDRKMCRDPRQCEWGRARRAKAHHTVFRSTLRPHTSDLALRQAANKEWWRERLAAKKVEKTPLAGVPLPVDPSYDARGQRRNDIDVYPHDDDRPPPEPEREYAQPAPPLDPKVPPPAPSIPPSSPPSPYPNGEDSWQTYTWSEDFEGINHVLWEAAGENDLPLLRQALSDGAQVLLVLGTVLLPATVMGLRV